MWSWRRKDDARLIASIIPFHADFSVSWNVDWRDYIHQDKGILQGKPVLKGTRLSVELILDCLAAGWSQEKLLYNYPS